MLVQRDFGDRTNRKHARLKYTVDDHGIDWFREQVEEWYACDGDDLIHCKWSESGLYE